MDCPNDRYVNDEQICQAIVSMLAKVGIKSTLVAQPKAKYFAAIAPRAVATIPSVFWGGRRAASTPGT